MKKVLSLVLVLALVLGSFSMAFAAETKTTNMSDVAGNANEGAIVVANDLGIVTGYNDGTFKPANAVTRAEFAAMMTRALAIPESALKGFKTSSFKDVASDHWAVAYLGYCNSKGIMTGYEDGTARPNQTITVNEAMTMICRALGYTAQAKELVGAWPANYIALGQQLGLYDDVAATATTDRASAAQIIYNSLTVPVKYIDADGVTRNLTDGDGAAVTMLGSLGGNQANGGNGFVLNSTMAESAVINVNEYVGQFVSAFLDKDGDIIAVEVLSTTITGDYNLAKEQIEGDDATWYFDQTNNYDYTAIAANGAKTADVAPMHVVDGKTVVAAAPAIADEDTVTLAVKINGKTITEVYSYIEWNVAAMDQFEEDDLNIEKAKINVNGTDYKFKTDKNGDIDAASFTLVGVTSLDKIAEDNIVEVYVAGGFITKLAVGTKTVTGEVTEANKAGSKFTIDGTKYAVATGGDVPAVGDTGTAYLTYDGDIAVWDVDDATSGNYGVFLGSRVEAGTTIASGVTMVGLVLKDGTVKEYEMTSSTKVVNKAGAEATANAAALAANDLVNYSFNSNGKISKLVQVGTAGDGVVGNANDGKTRIGNTKFASNVIVFEKDNDDDWTIGAVKNFSTDYDFLANNNIVGKNTKGEIEAIIVDKEDVLGSEDSFGLITSLVKRNNDGTTTWYVKGFVDGKAFEGFTDETGNTTTILTSDIGAAGLYKITIDADGTVSAVDKTPAVSNAAIGKIVKSVDKANKEITVSGGAVYGLTDNVAVYYYDVDEDEYSLSSIDKIGKGKNIEFVATGKSAWDDGLYNVVIYWND